MKNSSKIVLTIVAACFAVGCLLIVMLLFAAGSDEFDLNGEFTAKEDFKSISIDVGSSDVRILKTKAVKPQVKYITFETCEYKIEASNGVLSVIQLTESEDTLIFSSDASEVEILLPEGKYTDISFDSTSGNLKISNEIEFKSIRAYSESGDIEIFSNASETTIAKTDDGDIILENLTMGNIQAATTNGDIELENLRTKNLVAFSENGDIEIKVCEFSGVLNLETYEGDIKMENIFAETSNIKSKNGRVKGKALKK